MRLVERMGFAPLEIAALKAFSVAAGGMAAVAAVPIDLYPEDSLFLSGCLLAAGLLAPVVLGLTRESRTWLDAENVILGGLVYWILLDIIQSAYPLSISRESAVTELVAITIFGLTAVVG